MNRYIVRAIVVTAVATSLFAWSCTRNVGLVDRTQPNKVKKSMYNGEWYMLETVVEVPSNTNVLFEGYAAERIGSSRCDLFGEAGTLRFVV